MKRRRITRTDWLKLQTPSTFVHSIGRRDPFAPRRRGGKTAVTPALRVEVRRRLLAGVMLNIKELAKFYLVGKDTVARAIAFEEGRLAAENQQIDMGEPEKGSPDRLKWLKRKRRQLVDQQEEIDRRLELIDRELTEELLPRIVNL
jgi:hypothetical protein